MCIHGEIAQKTFYLIFGVCVLLVCVCVTFFCVCASEVRWLRHALVTR